MTTDEAKKVRFVARNDVKWSGRVPAEMEANARLERLK